jgi:hypothetical protein
MDVRGKSATVYRGSQMLQAAHPASAGTPSTSDTTFLDGLIADGKAEQQLQEKEVQGLDDFLNDLLGESMQEQAARNRLKECRKSLRNTATHGTARLALQKEVQTLEYVAEWTAVADVIWIKRCICQQCGHETPLFAGYFRKAHSRISKAYRWTALSSEVESDLPREIKEEMTTTPMCHDCLPAILMEDGWLNAEVVTEEFGEIVTEGPGDGDDDEDEVESAELEEQVEAEMEFAANLEEEMENGSSS